MLCFFIVQALQDPPLCSITHSTLVSIRETLPSKVMNKKTKNSKTRKVLLKFFAMIFKNMHIYSKFFYLSVFIVNFIRPLYTIFYFKDTFHNSWCYLGLWSIIFCSRLAKPLMDLMSWAYFIRMLKLSINYIYMRMFLLF